MSVSPGRVSVYGFGTLGLAAFVFKMLAVDYPDGDPARSRQAGDVWARLADRLEKNPDTTYPFAEAVWKKNGGDSVEAFKEAMISKLYPRPPETSFPDRLALACRGTARPVTSTPKSSRRRSTRTGRRHGLISPASSSSPLFPGRPERLAS
ncbi:hypothetical protein ACFQX6_28955 [Streptosporangium lutulentum]